MEGLICLWTLLSEVNLSFNFFNWNMAFFWQHNWLNFLAIVETVDLFFDTISRLNGFPVVYNLFPHLKSISMHEISIERYYTRLFCCNFKAHASVPSLRLYLRFKLSNLSRISLPLQRPFKHNKVCSLTSTMLQSLTKTIRSSPTKKAYVETVWNLLVKQRPFGPCLLVRW